MTDSPKTPAPPSSEQSIQPLAIQEKLKWFRLLFTLMLGGFIWTGLQVAEEKEELLNNVARLFAIQLDGLTAALIAMVALLTGLMLVLPVIHLNIGRLGDPGMAQAGRVQGWTSGIILLAGFPLFLCAPATAANLIGSGLHVVAIVAVLILCLVVDVCRGHVARHRQEMNPTSKARD